MSFSLGKAILIYANAMKACLHDTVMEWSLYNSVKGRWPSLRVTKLGRSLDQCCI